MQVKVWNDNVHDFSDANFKGEKIHIPSKGYIEMEFNEANEFRCKYSPMVDSGDGTQDPRSYKIIRIEKPESAKLVATPAGFPCQACGKTYESTGMLNLHIDENHLDALEDQDVASKRRFKPLK